MSSKNILKRFLYNPKLLTQLNILGPPSILIYKKCFLKYDPNLRYLVDIDFYFRILEKFYSKRVICIKGSYNLLSSQNNNHSITNTINKKIYHIKKIERQIILNKYKFKLNLSERLFTVYSYIILKINSFKSIRIYIKKIINE